MSIRVEFGNFLKRFRENQMLSQDILAENSGLLRYQIIAIEKGKSNYTVDNLFKYLHGLQVDSIDLRTNEEDFEFELTGNSMTLDKIREKIAEKLPFDPAWLSKLDDAEPGPYGVNDSDVKLSMNDIFVNIPQRTFEFKNARFYFDLNLISSKDGIAHKDTKEANGSGTFTFSGKNNDEIQIRIIKIDVDLDLMA
ncbi:helix-turn-helix transcriptional regulator [uncultured Roseivirga sp.]|uniref:helix-turn-helix domain-containing protein n=1 Tax=uncultured Roseivirga sp. TaxID=543088 RepID=UPI0030DDCE82|tara:strand:- start:9510 stop:10094 length:585 start_codon:yes stop_codon:yes gene_type:complete